MITKSVNMRQRLMARWLLLFKPPGVLKFLKSVDTIAGELSSRDSKSLEDLYKRYRQSFLARRKSCHVLVTGH